MMVVVVVVTWRERMGGCKWGNYACVVSSNFVCVFSSYHDGEGNTITHLLGLEPEAREPAQVLLAHRLVHRGAALDPLPVVVRVVRPPGYYIIWCWDWCIGGERGG